MYRINLTRQVHITKQMCIKVGEEEWDTSENTREVKFNPHRNNDHSGPTKLVMKLHLIIDIIF